MSERSLQFWVGLMVLSALSIGTALVVRFGDLRKEFNDRYAIEIHLETAGGLYPSAPVLMSGLSIGSVQGIEFAAERGVIVTAQIDSKVQLRADSRPFVARSLLGETVIEFVPGRSPQYLPPGARLQGEGASDPLAAIQRLEGRAVTVLDAFAETSREWQLVAKNVNGLMDTHQGKLEVVVARAAESLQQFTETMKTANTTLAQANEVIGDPQTQMALKQSMQGLPELVQETRTTIATARLAMESINRNLVNLSQVTEPVGKRGPLMVAKLESSLTSLDSLLGELNRFAQAVNQPNGTLNKLATDPGLYDNMDRSAQSLTVLLKNLEPLMRDLREFSDKIARNPELLGVGGALRTSSGLRDSELLNPQGPAQRTPTNTSGRATYRSQN